MKKALKITGRILLVLQKPEEYGEIIKAFLDGLDS